MNCAVLDRIVPNEVGGKGSTCPEIMAGAWNGGSDESHYGGSKSKIEVGSDPGTIRLIYSNTGMKCQRLKSGRVISLMVGKSI